MKRVLIGLLLLSTSCAVRHPYITYDCGTVKFNGTNCNAHLVGREPTLAELLKWPIADIDRLRMASDTTNELAARCLQAEKLLYATK